MEEKDKAKKQEEMNKERVRLQAEKSYGKGVVCGQRGVFDGGVGEARGDCVKDEPAGRLNRNKQ